jgi:hypothetical protein
MVQIPDSDILHRIVAGDVSVRDGIPNLIDNKSGTFIPPEGDLLDYKLAINGSQQSIAELARDILGFSNTEGGLLVVGVSATLTSTP